MSLIIEPKAEDFLVGRILDKGWYQFVVSGITVKPNKNDPSKNNVYVSFKCIGGQDNFGPAAGVDAKDRIFVLDAKGQGYLVNWAKSIGLDIVLGQKFDMEAWKDNVKFDGMCEMSEYQGMQSNEIRQFAKLGTFTSL